MFHITYFSNSIALGYILSSEMLLNGKVELEFKGKAECDEGAGFVILWLEK